MIEIPEVFDMLENNNESYIFIKGHPVDTRRSKYENYKFWFELDKLHCFSCLKRATHFKLVKCKGARNIHKQTGKHKYTLKLYSYDDTIFTFDHWFPRWFLKKYKVQNIMENNVPMCRKCNEKKDTTIPFLGLYKETFYLPALQFEHAS